MIKTATIRDACMQTCGAPIAKKTPCSGGCINEAFHATLENGQQVFIKRGTDARAFQCEAYALNKMPVKVPQVLAVADGTDEAFLLLEYLPPGATTTDFWTAAGQQLAQLHRNTNDRCGWDHYNFIGHTPQINTFHHSWPDFFAEHRLRYQLDLAIERGYADRSLISSVEHIIATITNLLPAGTQHSFLHGDLWNGNVFCATPSTPVFIDPAAYYGHREADLAMTELFGGFAPAFYNAYAEAYPLDPHYSERKPLYQLYHILNHLNTFGDSYFSQAQSLAAFYL